jgi:hypothetical protein
MHFARPSVLCNSQLLTWRRQQQQQQKDCVNLLMACDQQQYPWGQLQEQQLQIWYPKFALRLPSALLSAALLLLLLLLPPISSWS